MEEKTCSICGEENNDCFHTLKCNHTFHYNCLFQSFKSMRNNHCPYCRKKTNYLPLINGLRKVIPGVHCNMFGSSFIEAKLSLKNNYSVPCQHILIRGKNKGSTCNKNCFLGYKYCKAHKKDINLITDSVINQSTTQALQDDTNTSSV